MVFRDLFPECFLIGRDLAADCIMVSGREFFPMRTYAKQNTAIFLLLIQSKSRQVTNARELS